MSSRLSSIEHRISKTEEKLQQQSLAPTCCSEEPLEATPARSRTSSLEDEMIVPPMSFLKGSKQIQKQVDQRLQQLSAMTEKSIRKSQRGGSETVYVAKQVPWPQNKILAGSLKNRVSYDSLSVYQWVSGFSTIIRE